MMGIELELVGLLVLAVVGQSIFARFEIETPPWRKIVKWFVLTGVTLGIHRFAGHWALLFPHAMAMAGMTFHFI